mgnify:FL=1
MTKHNPGVRVPPQSRKSLRAIATSVHFALQHDCKKPFPIVEITELVLPKLINDFDFQVRSIEEMGNDHGMTYPDRHIMCIREDVYERACRDYGRDRYTMCHEFAHLLIHEGIDVALARGEDPLKPYEDSEWQANALAGELLMPYAEIRGMSPDEVSSIYLVSAAAAKTQLRLIG